LYPKGKESLREELHRVYFESYEADVRLGFAENYKKGVNLVRG
jgi:hypothetical protein